MTLTGSTDWEGQERPLRQWDFVHCPAKTQHVIVGAGDGPCVVARRYGASVEEDTQDGDVAYANWPSSQPTGYRKGWLPDG